MPKIIYKDENIVVIDKPVGMPSQSDISRDTDAMTATSKLLSDAGEVGKLFLIHRLDRGVGGLMVFARNKRCAAELSSAIQNRSFSKEYLAIAKGIPEDGVYKDYLFKDSSSNKSYAVRTERRGAKYAELSLSKIAAVRLDEGARTLVRVKLSTGRHHQIRVQLSSRKTPLVGDKKYGGGDALCCGVALFAFSLSFDMLGREYSFFAKPNTDIYPWKIFKDEVDSI